MKNIRALRLKKGITQSDLASALKVTVRTVQRMEKGKVRDCYLTDLKRILQC